METVTIKAIPSLDNPQLNLKYVGTNEYITPGVGPDGKLITGFDENAYHILTIEDDEVRKKTQASVLKERKELEKLLGRDLGLTSTFWDDFYYILTDDVKLTPTKNALDRVIERFLVANKKVAPSLDAVETDETFENCMFYMHRESEATASKAQEYLSKDKAVAKMVILLDKNPQKLKNIASFILGFDVSNDFSAENAYVKLKEFASSGSLIDQKKNTKRLIEVLDKSNEELAVKIIIDKAIKARLIKVRNGVHRRNDIVLGNTYEETVEFLVSPENSSEILSLQRELK